MFDLGSSASYQCPSSVIVDAAINGKTITVLVDLQPKAGRCLQGPGRKPGASLYTRKRFSLSGRCLLIAYRCTRTQRGLQV
jgi:hypothetical protein